MNIHGEWRRGPLTLSANNVDMNTQLVAVRVSVIATVCDSQTNN